MTRLRLGPLLRHVGGDSATVWVETEAAATVEVLGHREQTWEVAGHHYALVTVTGLRPGSCTEYDVRVDGTVLWPEPGDRRPAPRIRTLAHGSRLRVVFGSCRFATPEAVGELSSFEPDALDAYAKRMAGRGEADWPDLLLLLGDQVYADETSSATRDRIRARRDVTQPPGEQVSDFEEYTWLYEESWTDPDVRWLLSTVPTAMIFDDHDIADDWNTSGRWRADMARTSWWHERVVSGLSSYWVYQHLGNLSPAELADNELYQRVRVHGDDCAPMLRDFAAAADREADGQKGARWSYRRDLDGVRLVVVDSRCGRVLEEGRRSMISDAEFDWIEAQCDGTFEHLLVATSLPWLMARALHDVEAWNEVLAAGARGRAMAAVAEWYRQAADLEHWAAFRDSFDRLAGLIAAVGRGQRAPDGRPPATVCVLSGDVHHAYVAQAEYPDPTVRSAVYQLTCSPVHNYVPVAMRGAFQLAWSRAAEKAMRFVMDRVARVPHQPLSWRRLAGSYYGNEIATLTLEGRAARLRVERSGPGSERGLVTVVDIALS